MKEVMVGDEAQSLRWGRRVIWRLQWKKTRMRLILVSCYFGIIARALRVQYARQPDCAQGPIGVFKATF
jgi:hypothetical protein